MKSFSGILTRLQGGIEKLSGVVETKAIEENLGKEFTCRDEDDYRMTFRRFKDDPSRGYFIFERIGRRKKS